MVEQNSGRERGFAGARKLSKSRLAETDEVIGRALERVRLKPDEGASRHGSLGRDVDRVLSTLSARERWVTEMRNGLLDGRIWTQAETARKLGVSRRTVGRDERSALAKLRPASRSS